ncbi:MAG TPA: hypothetical protein DEB31_07070 [Clostridiales bacterium]|nr:hypothetical protein [Clostridiales bacterium]
MKALKYSEWTETAHILHMVFQMMGKVKLVKLRAQPEWSHVLIYPTAKGFSTGLIPDGGRSFTISLHIGDAMVYAHSTDGAVAGFPLRGRASVSEYYQNFTRMLAHINHTAKFSSKPQEVPDTTPFEAQATKYDFDRGAAEVYFENCIFAHNALLDFASPFRGKKILPALFWGTFDMTAVLFAGVDQPFPGKGVIEKSAFDEKLMEFGFWPGDAVVEEPNFFVLPYPFVQTPISTENVTPKEAVFSTEKKEFFLPLKDVLRYGDPAGTVKQFCRDAFAAVCKAESWQGVEWFTKPLLIPGAG